MSAAKVKAGDAITWTHYHVIRSIGLAALVAAIAACGSTAHPAPHVYRATAQQPTCQFAQLGTTRLYRYPGGPVFRAWCERDGRIATWNTRPAPRTPATRRGSTEEL